MRLAALVRFRVLDFQIAVADHGRGGSEVQAFEEEWAKKFGAKYAVSMNSATSGVIAAIGAAGIEPASG